MQKILKSIRLIDIITISISFFMEVIMSIDFFTNDRYKILSCMAERLIEVSGKIYAPISQRQISEITGLAFKTVNAVIKELRDNDYIDYEGTTRGKYYLTDKAKKDLDDMQKTGVEK